MYLVTRDDVHFQQAASYDVAYRKQMHQGKSLGLDAANMSKNDEMTRISEKFYHRRRETNFYT